MKRPILYCFISFSSGIFFSYLFNIPFIPVLALTLFSIILSAVFVKNNILSHLFLYVALVLFGVAYCQNFQTLPDDHISRFALEKGAKVSIKGIVVDDPVIRKAFYNKERVSFTIRSDLLIDGSMVRTVTGLVKTDLYTDKIENLPKFGDEVIMEGTLSRPEGLKNPKIFDYSKYLSIKNIYAAFSANGEGSIRIIKSASADSLQGRAYFLRHRIRETITRYVDKPYSAFLKAVLIGDRTELENSVTDDFVKTGTVHVLVISGLHIGLIAALLLFILKMLRVPKKYNLAITAFAIIFYSFVAGSNPPVMRATIIFVIFAAGYLINREADTLNSLSMAGLLILLWNPKELFDPSFQLSFASVFSIVLFAPRIEEILKFKPAYISKSISVSIAASLGVFPIAAKYFNIFPPVAVIANLIIIPVLFVIIAMSFVFLALNFLGISLFSHLLGGLLSLSIYGVFCVNHILSKIPFSYIRIPAPSFIFLIFYYLALFALFFIPRKRYAVIAVLLAANIMVWGGGLDGSRKLLRVTFLDVGKADSALVQFPGSGAILIDGGGGGIEGVNDMGRNVAAPYLWNNGIRRLDAVFISHFHEDHLGGLLYILSNFDVGEVFDNGALPVEDRNLYEEYINIIKRKKIRRIIVSAGDEITGFGDAKIFIMNPPQSEDMMDLNDNSLVFKLEYKNIDVLFCGDISANAIERLMNYGDFLRADVIKIPHHGGSIGDDSIAKEFFEKVSPKISVISTGGRFGFFTSSKGTLSLLDSLGSDIYETKKNGAIKVLTDGSGLKLEVTQTKN